MKFLVKNLGCRANYSDGHDIEDQLIQKGGQSVSRAEDADFIVINSCTVTQEADDQSKKLARDLKKKNPNTKVIFTGCSAEVDPQAAANSAGIDLVVGNIDKFRFSELLNFEASEKVGSDKILGSVQGYEELLSKHPMDREWPEAELQFQEPSRQTSHLRELSRTRAFVRIQEGCQQFCTYCIIPYGRGPSRSLNPDSVITTLLRLQNEGVQEVVLTGTNIGDYGLELKPATDLGKLLQRILNETQIERIRLGSLDPTEITDEIWNLIQTQSRMCPHIHLSLQHTETEILRRMKRKYSKEDVIHFFDRVRAARRPIFLGMDLIVGFPGETEALYQDMLSVLKDHPWSRIHVFPYSEREGTPATKLPNAVEKGIRKKRAKEVFQLSLDRMSESFRVRRSPGVVELSEVLVENEVKGPDGTRNWLSGYTKDYQRVLIPKNLGGLILKSNTVLNFYGKNWFLDRVNGECVWMAEGMKTC